MSDIIVPLRKTTPTLHRIWVLVDSYTTWYAIINDLNKAFGKKNWRGKKNVKKTLDIVAYATPVWPLQRQSVKVSIWFEVPDPSIFTMLSLKYNLTVSTTKPANCHSGLVVFAKQ